MPLSSEHMRRIEEEERLRLEEENYRAAVRRQLRRKAIRGRLTNRRSILAMAAIVAIAATIVFGLSTRQRAKTQTQNLPPRTSTPVFGTASAPVPKNPETAAVARNPLPLPAKPGETPPDGTRSRSTNALPADLAALLTRWESSARSTDLDSLLACYAPKVEVFYNRRKVDRNFVRADKKQVMSTYPKVRRLDVSNVRLESLSDKRAVISFMKEWDMAGARQFSGAERQRLTVERIDGQWRIVGEKDEKIYWMKRG